MEIIDLYSISMKRFKSLIARMRMLEAIHNPEECCVLPTVNTKQDLRNYADCEEVNLILDTHFYLLMSKFEIIDFASSKVLTRAEVREILIQLNTWFGINTFMVDVKEKGSYHLIKGLCARGILSINSEYVWYRGDEKMIEMCVSFIKGVSK